MNGRFDDEQKVLDCLKQAVHEALDRKRRLGQYAVVWQDGKVAYIGPNPPVRAKRSDPAQRQPAGSGR
ncbi:MAG: hypothetical protein L0H54_11725 [Alcaligenaceae bacterium]|nr:hypothetical protein [Alcaligenaceae bacterium]